jgi:multidrug efflux pump subunit AcrB
MPKSGVPLGVFGMAALITYLILAALFGSWLHPFVIIMSVPFALVGGLRDCGCCTQRAARCSTC